MRKHYSTVFFDWGGVVAEDAGKKFLGLLLRRSGATEEQVREISKTYMEQFMRGQLSEDVYKEAVQNKYGISAQYSLSDEFRAWKGLEAYDEVLGFVAEMRQNGLKVAILSNVIEPTYCVLEEAGFYALFDEIIASCKVGYAKPEHQIFTLALEKLNATPEQSIFVDDRQRNLDIADEMGFTTVLAKSPSQTIQDVRALIEW